MKESTKHKLISNPKNIICIGLNYADHIAETSLATHDFPEIFMKTTNALAGHQDTITIEDVSFHYDYEGELVIVIGKSGKNIPRDKAKEHILGYTIGNDVSARALQFRGSQWILGKSLDNFAPIGPVIVSHDEFDFDNATITTTVNGEVRQQAKLEQMLFKPDAIIEFVSQYITLQEGDIIFTGTPSGVVLGKNEKRYGWLKSGDTVSISISGIGTLVNQFK
ncbi:fumarylacetoacetate hydrolase family protein [Veillonella sp.]|uniref:fumarylacetoacetate hydrolase family protein n=1 Tax=Veillonella sp. TaxID=1926307 RepID=UPI0028FF2D4B|nr:fumarylacetoacetate hydrolase family protein [Veillonella sp.]MDU2334537.1 fumarylacetoacetate hydrolase family protein [Veillonella sp.]MDU2347642.1 fumarylacetoacetate hydrolase family protein [Veillonella sp.]